MKRSKHTLSHYRLNTANFGQVFPIACVPVLPGDTLQHHTSALVRVSPLNTPVMHPTAVRIHHFYVPNRIVWDGWEKFITGGADGNDQSTIPTITQGPSQDNNLLTYLGVPPIQGLEVNALPVYAANMIFNEYYRDQDLVPDRSETDVSVMRCAWEKDAFTKGRPWSQKGPQVSVPVGKTAPVYAQANNSIAGVQYGQGGSLVSLSTNGGPGSDKVFPDVGTAGINPLQVDLEGATGVSVNDFRASFAIQRYQEARARYGSRFTEYLRYLGIKPSDARLQRPEFLGGGSSRLQFSEVLQTTPAGQQGEAGVGDLYGHGIAGARTNRYRKFFEEHGYVITMMSIRPKALYVNGVPREFFKKTKEDYYQKELAHLGQQEILQKELHGGSGDGVFGYQNRYEEYRSHMSQVGQNFANTLNSFHMGRDLAPDPVLNQSFIECDPSSRIFQVAPTGFAHTAWIFANHHIVARRLVPRNANPRIL